MRIETVRLLAYVTVPVALLAIIWPAPGGSGGTDRIKPVVILPGLRGHMDDVASLTVKSGGNTVHLTRKPVAKKPGEGWVVADKSDYPAEPATVRPVLEGVRALRGTARRTAQASLYGRLDLDVSKDGGAREVILANGAGKVLGDVFLGREKDDSAGQGHAAIYVRTPDSPRTWLAEPPVTVPTDALDWLNKTVVSVEPDRMATVTVTQGGDTMIVARPKAGADLVLMDLPKAAKLKTPSAPADLAAALRGLELTDVEPAAKLSGPPAGEAKFETLDGLTVTATVTKLGGANWVTVSAAGTGKAGKDADAITARVKGWAYRVDDARAQALLVKRADLIDMPKPVVAPAPPSKPAAAPAAATPLPQPPSATAPEKSPSSPPPAPAPKP